MNPADIVLWKAGGPRYRTRDGRLAVVLESNADGPEFRHSFWQGRVGGEWEEWELDGTHRGGDPALDLVEVAQ